MVQLNLIYFGCDVDRWFLLTNMSLLFLLVAYVRIGRRGGMRRVVVGVVVNEVIIGTFVCKSNTVLRKKKVAFNSRKS